jgi:hypothetical protein
MRVLLLLLTFFIPGLYTYGQEMALQVIAAAGGIGATGSLAAEWTVGEPVIATLTGATSVLTQGFHQPEIKGLVGIRADEGINTFIDVYPNPAADFLILSLDTRDLKDFYYELYNLDGTFLEQKLLESKQTLIDMTGYPAGVYALKVIQADQEIKIFKIVKP